MEYDNIGEISRPRIRKSIRLRSARETRYAPRRRVHEHRSTNYLHTLSDYAERERVSSLCKFARGGNLCTTSL